MTLNQQRTQQLWRGWRKKFNTPAKRRKLARKAALARAAILTAEERSEIGKLAGRATWYGEFIPMSCPHCNLSETRHNGKRNGRQRWHCRPCNRSWYETAIPPKPPKGGPACPDCASTVTMKAGTRPGKHGPKQRYICRSCRRCWTGGLA